MNFAIRKTERVTPGSEFHKWTVLGWQFRIRCVVRKTGAMSCRWFCVCRCECGTVQAVEVANIVNNLSRSCGCVRADLGTNGSQEPLYLPKPAEIRRASQRISQHWSEEERDIRSRCIPVGKRDLLALRS